MSRVQTRRVLVRQRANSTVNERSVAGLFAGVAGIELGLAKSGFHSSMFCEKDEAARAVLAANFPDAKIHEDIRDLRSLGSARVVAAGFPCQDLSMAGPKVGIRGHRSGLVTHLLELLAARGSGSVEWLIIENVAYMLKLDRGRAMAFLVHELEALGYRWAYRVVDPRGFGIPQRRHRVILLASKKLDPRPVLLGQDEGALVIDDRSKEVDPNLLYGFYWTEGLRGLGWTPSGVPAIKGGSGLGIPSPPAVWNPKSGEIGTIDLRDAERLQGMPVNWTRAAADVAGLRATVRWKLVGNAVCSPVAAWLGRRLTTTSTFDVGDSSPWTSDKWPWSAWGEAGKVFSVERSMYPEATPYRHLHEFLKYPLKPLSARATEGYRSRLRMCSCNPHPQFVEAIDAHAREMSSVSRRAFA